MIDPPSRPRGIMVRQISYTAKERAAIVKAYQELTYRVDTQAGGSLVQYQERAYKAAKTQAHNPTEARAWVLRAFLRGVEGGETMLAKDLEGLAEWWLFGVLLGVGYVVRRLHQDSAHAQMAALVQNGIAAHEAARTRQLEAVT